MSFLSIEETVAKKKKLKEKERRQSSTRGPNDARQLSGYRLWCSHYRDILIRENKNVTIGEQSKILSNLWKEKLPEQEKARWDGMAERVNRGEAQVSDFVEGKVLDDRGRVVAVGSETAPKPPTPLPSSAEDDQVTTMDAAAHLKLLGMTLTTLADHLATANKDVPLSGALGVLLDAFVCALPPLACLTNEVEQLEGAIPSVTSANTFDNIAYIMPGL